MNAPLSPIPVLRKNARPGSDLFDELIVDNFAGGGGASMGIEAALGRCVDVAINHDRAAVEMHSTNHPHTRHLCEDVWSIDPVQATGRRPVGLAWFSPDCKHFSRAKGGKPVEKKIRGLAWVVVKWAKRVKPRVIILENVREFEDWGPLDKYNMPCAKRKGRTFRRWVSSIRNLGYAVEWRVLNAADHGAPTHRRRLFLIARCDGRPIVWPEPTHGPGRAKPYRTAAECIDWTLPCPSIFLTRIEGRKLGVNRPLADKTMRRIAMGLKRFVLDNPKPFIVNVQHGGDEFRGQSVGQPLGAVTGKHGYGVVKPRLTPSSEIVGGECSNCSHEGWANDDGTCRNCRAKLVPYVAGVGGRAGQSPATGGDAPLGTITAKNDRAVITPHLVKLRGNEGAGIHGCDPEQPLPTVCAGATTYGVAAPILVGAGGPGYSGKPTPADAPMGTVMTENHRAVATATFIAKHFGGVVGHGPERPLGTVTAVDHHSLVAANLIHMNHGEKKWSGCDEPTRTQTTSNHAGLVYSFLTKYYGTNIGHLPGEPLQTVTSRDRFGLVTVNVGGEPYVIADIGLRMLTPRELARAQGFPDSYVLTGTKSSQVARIGNSVCPVMAEALVRANCMEMARSTKNGRTRAAGKRRTSGQGLAVPAAPLFAGEGDSAC